MERKRSMFRHRQRAQRCKELQSFVQGQAILAEHLCEFAALLFRGLLSVELEQPLEQIRERKKCCICKVRYTPAFPTGVWLVCHLLFQHVDQTAFANTCLTREYDNLSVPSFRLPPTLQEQPNFL